MKNKILIPSVIISALLAFFSFRFINTYAQPQGQNAIIQQTIMGLMQEGHYAPREINDSFSKLVFDKTIEGFDYDKKFLLQSDYDQLKKRQFSIDDEIKNNQTGFFNELNGIFVKRIDEADKFYKSILDKPFTFNTQDSIQLDGEKLNFAKNESELKARWTQMLKYRTLAKYAELKKAETDKVKDSAGYKAKTDVTLEAEARETVSKIQERYFKRLKKLNENDRFALYMNSVTSAEDPHSDFFPPEDRKRFDEAMSGNFIGIGAQLQVEEDGKTKVQAIITGSPSWKQGQLKKGDIIEKVEGEEKPPVDIDGYDIEDVVKLIRGKKGTTVKLHVQHEDGSKQIIPIVRDQVDLEDTYAKSAIIENAGKRIGYIYLPEFYTNFTGNPNGHTSGEDVKKEVVKLMSEDVDGIVLDLRNNGGGSLGDVVDMAGIFIGTGPVVQVRAKGNRVMTLKSKEDKPIYTGPLAIMVNGGSASASEILAAAMQDYGRAVIIGSNTFGKGTVQKLVPLDPYVTPEARKSIIDAWMKAKDGDARFEGIGSLKLTIQKFYRINGGSTQIKGVTPDILLPDVYDQFDEIGESKNKAAMKWDKIKASEYPTFNSIPELNVLARNSQTRVNATPTFNMVEETSARLKKQRDHNWMPLSYAAYQAKQKEAELISKKVEQIDSAKTKLVVVNPKADVSRVNIDESSKEKNTKWLDALKKDAYLNETANVLNEWIKMVAARK